MINTISNIKQVASELNLIPIKQLRSLPKLNSFVAIEVLDKVNSNYKILVDGSLFQSKLPINAKIGDLLFAQVSKMQPFSLILNNFSFIGIENQSLATLILQKLNLFGSSKSRKIVDLLISEKRNISKEKLSQLIDYVENSSFNFDEIQSLVLVNIFFDENDNESYASKKHIFNNIFNISFDELVNKIYRKVVFLNSQNLPEEIYNQIKTTLTFPAELFENQKTVNGLSVKPNQIVLLVEKIDDFIRTNNLWVTLKSELEEFADLLVKFLLQKSVLNKYQLYYDFTITIGKLGISLWQIRYHKIISGFEEIYKIESKMMILSENHFNSEFIYSDRRITGSILFNDNKLQTEKTKADLSSHLRKSYANESNISWLKQNYKNRIV